MHTFTEEVLGAASGICVLSWYKRLKKLALCYSQRYGCS